MTWDLYRGGTPIPGTDGGNLKSGQGVLHPRSRWSISGLDKGYPIPGLDRGTSILGPDGGYLHP